MRCDVRFHRCIDGRLASEVPRNWISWEIGTNSGKSDFGRSEDTDEPKILSYQVSANLGVNFRKGTRDRLGRGRTDDTQASVVRTLIQPI